MTFKGPVVRIIVRLIVVRVIVMRVQNLLLFKENIGVRTTVCGIYLKNSLKKNECYKANNPCTNITIAKVSSSQ